MHKVKILFIDRDGTLVKEPETKQIDRLDQLQLVANVIPALLELKKAGYQFVMVSNQDGLGSDNYPMETFELIQTRIVDIFCSQGIVFSSIKICPHYEQDKCFCRKPRPGLVLDYLCANNFDRKNSFVIGDRQTDLELAEAMGISGLLINQHDVNAWDKIVDTILFQPRSVTLCRKTKETEIHCILNLDAEKDSEIATGIGFFDHMLHQLAKHGGFYLQLKVKGDLDIDDHHVVEDVAIVIGQAIRQALGEKRGIERYGFLLPMDDALASVAIDLCGRSFLKFNASFTREHIGNLATEMIKHFFLSFSSSLLASIHISCEGENTHHMIESIFKAVGKTLRQAILKINSVLPTTKGVI